MSRKTCFYKGVNRVKVVTESEGYWLIEALEDFVDTVDGKRVTITAGERRLVPPDTLNSEKVLPPPVPEHVYERCMEKKVQQMVKQEDAKEHKQITKNVDSTNQLKHQAGE